MTVWVRFNGLEGLLNKRHFMQRANPRAVLLPLNSAFLSHDSIVL
jgi:hypothetical protein